MEQPILDMSFLYQLSAMEPGYMCDVINLFLEVMPDGIVKLEKIAKDTDDFDAIHKQAHYLKSSAAIIKIKDIHQNLTKVISLSREERNKPEILALIDEIVTNFNLALPLLSAEKERFEKAKTVSLPS